MVEQEKQKGTVRVWLEQFKVRDFEVARAAIAGLTAAGFDVEVKPFTPYHEKTGQRFPEHAYQTITVYRKEG